MRFWLALGLMAVMAAPVAAAPAKKKPATAAKRVGAPVNSAAAAQLVKQRCAGLSGRINAHDLRGVRTYFSPDIRVKTTRGRTQSYFQVLQSMSRTFKRFPKYRTQLDVQKVVVRGDRAYLTAAYNNSGMKKPDRGRCNMVWKKSGSRWMLASLTGA